MDITFDIKLPPDLSTLISRLRRPRDLMQHIGGEAESAVKRHFTARSKEPNKRGWAHTGWWKEQADATHLTSVSADSATVEIQSDQFTHRHDGGDIHPRPGKRLLAIPLREEAQRAGWPKEKNIPNLFLLLSHGKLFLAKDEDKGFNTVTRATRWKRAQGVAKKANRLTLYYRLVTKVHHNPDPRALPNMDALRAELIAEAETLLTAQK